MLHSCAAAEVASTAEKEKSSPTKTVDNSANPTSGVEDLFKDSVPEGLVPQKPQKDVKNDIMSLFEKVSSISAEALVFMDLWIALQLSFDFD